MNGTLTSLSVTGSYGNEGIWEYKWGHVLCRMRILHTVVLSDSQHVELKCMRRSHQERTR